MNGNASRGRETAGRNRSKAPREGDSEATLSIAPPGPTDLSSADLFADYHDRIRGYILTMVRDPEEADDLTQDVFLQAHRKLGSLRDQDAVVSWLYRIATHICYDQFRKWSRQPKPATLDLTGPPSAPAATGDDDEPRLDRVLERADMSACVRGYLDDLSDEYRNVILLHDLQGLTNREIADMLGDSLDAVKIRLHRARRKLEAALEANCDFSYDDHGVFVCEPTTAPALTSARPEPGLGPAAYPSSTADRPE